MTMLQVASPTNTTPSETTELLQRGGPFSGSLLSRLRAGELQFNAPIATALLHVVDAVREMLASIETAGNEGGGDYSALISAVDHLRTTGGAEPRIRVAVISGALNVMQERLAQPYSCGAQIIPGLLQYGDVPEIAALIAPRHVVWEIGSRDSLIKPQWAEEALARMRMAYHALDADDRLMVDRFDGTHQWHGKMAYEVLQKVLG